MILFYISLFISIITCLYSAYVFYTYLMGYEFREIKYPHNFSLFREIEDYNDFLAISLVFICPVINIAFIISLPIVFILIMKDILSDKILQIRIGNMIKRKKLNSKR